jgi:hypothetical protein
MTTRRARTELRRRAIALLDQQLWCWGRDVVRPEGNILLSLGMSRHRSTAPEALCTAYTGRVVGGGVVWLWGFGLVYCLPNQGGVFLRRYGFDPVLVREPWRPVHQPDQLGPFTRPTSVQQRATAAELVRAAALWIAGYEHWIAETFGTAYREATLATRNVPPAVPAKEMASAWENLAKNSARLSEMPWSYRGPWSAFLDSLRRPSIVVQPQLISRFGPRPQPTSRFGPHFSRRFSTR